MRLVMVVIVYFGLIYTRVSAQDCIPAEGEPITLGAVFPQGFLLLDDSSNAYNAVFAMTDVFNQCNNGLRPVAWQLEVAASYDDAVEAMERFSENGIPLVIGSGMDSVSEGLNESAAEHQIVFYDVTQRPRQMPSEWSFTLRPADTTLGTLTAQYIQTEVTNTLLSEPLRVALVVEDTPRAITMADAVRDQLAGSIVVDENIRRNTDLAVNIREADANVLILISISQDATDLWFDMRQANANVGAWLFLGQEQLTITYRYVDDRDTTGVMIVGSQHFAVESIEQAISPAWYASFLEEYYILSDDMPDYHVLSAAVGTYYLLSSVVPQISAEPTSHGIREIMQNSTDVALFDMTGRSPLVVRQNQETGYCIVSPTTFVTCTEPMQPFPTWRQRVLNNQ